jgi:hypothetical protein
MNDQYNDGWSMMSMQDDEYNEYGGDEETR